MKKRLLIFVVAYNAENTLRSVLERVPSEVFDNLEYDTQILVIDDSSGDSTFLSGATFSAANRDLPLLVLRNPQNLGYGGNQKLGYRYAIDQGFDFVALLHGDGQYAPEALPALLQPLLRGESDAVFGSRMMVAANALKGGMPVYKFVGNKILTFLQNKIVGTRLSEYHSGYRIYSCAALDRVPFELNSNYFDFDTEIIIQLARSKAQITEIPIPTFYGNEICYVNGLSYAYRILLASLLSRCQGLGIFYDPKFDLNDSASPYRSKFHFRSSHSMVLDSVREGERLLILGAGSYQLVRPYIDKKCAVSCLDQTLDPELSQVAEGSIEADLDGFDLNRFGAERFDKVLLPDIIEHLRSPEVLLNKIRNCSKFDGAEVVITTPNIAFIVVRLRLLLGSFSYGKTGILDMTHTRLFTFRSLRRLLTQHGYEVELMEGVPAPFPLAVGDNWFGRRLLALNGWLIGFFPGLFSYQILCRARPQPTVKKLLSRTFQHSAEMVRKVNSD